MINTEISCTDHSHFYCEKCNLKKSSIVPSTNELTHTSICWYIRVLPVLHRPDMVDIGVYRKICRLPKGL